MSNGISSLSIKLAEESGRLEELIDDNTESISNVAKDLSTLAVNSMHYYGDLVTDEDATLSGCLEHTYRAYGSVISAGSMNRIPDSISVPDFLGNIIELNKNDYIIFNSSISAISTTTSADFSIIRDAQEEVTKLSIVMQENDTAISNWIVRNFANTGENDRLLTTILNYDLSAHELSAKRMHVNFSDLIDFASLSSAEDLCSMF